MRNKVIAALLALILGSFGLHKFYLGKIGWGIAYLIFFWTWIPTIISIVEGIIYLSISEKSFNTKYNSNIS